MLATDMVKGFDCGQEPWESEITDWLKRLSGQDSAVGDAAAGNPVWLYVSDVGELVGVASVGFTEASYPKNSSKKRPAPCITWLGVDRRHRKKGYGVAILNHVLAECLTYIDRTLVTAYVRQGNPALHLYTDKYGFVVISPPNAKRNCYIIGVSLT